MNLSNEEKLKFANIIFKSEGREEQEINRLSEEQMAKIKSLYAQKIAYDAVNEHIQPPPEYSPQPVEHAPKPGIISTICCCFFPENNRDNFDITTGIYFKRVFGTYMFWRNNFLDIDGGKTEFYGPLWITISYIIILGLAANLNEYFILPENYQFNNEYMIKGFGATAIFKIAEPLIYSAVLKCLGGNIPTNESVMLTGYSLVLYFVPTLLCLIPSLYWHIAMLALGGFLRMIFLFRNYGSKLESKTYIILVVILILEALFCYILLKTMFTNDSGYSVDDGTKKVFGHKLAMRYYQQ